MLSSITGACRSVYVSSVFSEVYDSEFTFSCLLLSSPILRTPVYCVFQSAKLSYPNDGILYCYWPMQIKDGFAEGKDLVVSVMSAMGEEQICALKDIGPKNQPQLLVVCCFHLSKVIYFCMILLSLGVMEVINCVYGCDRNCLTFLCFDVVLIFF